MKTVFCSFGLLMAAVPVFAQNTGKDSIVSTKALDDVVVSVVWVIISSSIPTASNENMRSMDSGCWKT
jgi:hypothetical protein